MNAVKKSAIEPDSEHVSGDNKDDDTSSKGRNKKFATDDHLEQDGAEADAEEAEADEEEEEGIAISSVPEVLEYFGISGVTAKCPGWASKKFIAACMSKVSNSWVHQRRHKHCCGGCSD